MTKVILGEIQKSLRIIKPSKSNFLFYKARRYEDKSLLKLSLNKQ